jgi:molybdopterin converting factor small subunit
VSETRVVLPAHLRALAKVDGETVVDGATVHQVLAELEARHPSLKGTLRDPATGVRRPFVRFFACGEDLSHDDVDAPLPDAVLRGVEPLLVIGAMAGG